MHDYQLISNCLEKLAARVRPLLNEMRLAIQAVMGALTLWFPEELQESAASIPTATLASVYVSKLVKVPNYSGAKVHYSKLARRTSWSRAR